MKEGMLARSTEMQRAGTGVNEMAVACRSDLTAASLIEIEGVGERGGRGEVDVPLVIEGTKEGMLAMLEKLGGEVDRVDMLCAGGESRDCGANVRMSATSKERNEETLFAFSSSSFRVTSSKAASGTSSAALDRS